MPFVAFLELTRLSEAVCLIVKEDNTVFKKKVAIDDTELGKLILANRDQLRREAPFAMLAEDPASKEDFVVRGIIDGYLLLEDRIAAAVMICKLSRACGKLE